MTDTWGDIDYLRYAIFFALEADDGLEWLREWNSGGVKEGRQLSIYMEEQIR